MSSRDPPGSEQRKGIPPFSQARGNGSRATFNTKRSHGLLFYSTPSTCILTLHPVILPIPYLVFSHLVKLTACILCFMLHSIPCIVVGLCVRLCKRGCMFVKVCLWASVDKSGCVSRCLSSVCRVELNRLKRSARGILDSGLGLDSWLRSSFCLLPDFIGR